MTRDELVQRLQQAQRNYAAIQETMQFLALGALPPSRAEVVAQRHLEDARQALAQYDAAQSHAPKDNRA